jgi:hypothetical protein
MDIQTEKIALIKLLLDTQKESVLNKIKQIFIEEEESLSISEKKAIDEAIYSLEKNKGIPHDQVMEETKERYPNLLNTVCL